MVGVTTLLDFILRLLSDPELAEKFSDDPEGSLDDHGLSQIPPQDAANAIHSVTTLLGGGGGTAFIPVPHAVPVAVPVPIVVGGPPAPAPDSTADILQNFVMNYYGDGITANNVWAQGDVAQALAAPGGIAVVGGEEAEHINVAAGGSVAVSGGIEDSGLALNGGVAAGGDVEFEGNDDVVIGDGNVDVEGFGNTVVGDDQVTVTGSNGVNVADEGSTIQVADNGGVNAVGDAIVGSNVAGDDLAVGDGAVAADGNVATGAGAIATDGNVASGANAQAAGDDSNLASDDDVFSPTVTTSGDVTLDLDDSDAISSGNNSGAAADGAVVATGAAIVSQDNDALTNTVNVSAGGVVGGLSQSNSVDSNSAVGIGNVAADDQSVAAAEGGAAAGYTGGDAQAASGESQVANNGSLNAGENGVIGDGGVAASGGSTVAYTTGDNSDAAVAAEGGTVAQGDAAVAGGNVYDNGATVTYDQSFNEDSNFTAGDDSPILAAEDAEVEDIDFDY
jgi:hypothetical protein